MPRPTTATHSPFYGRLVALLVLGEQQIRRFIYASDVFENERWPVRILSQRGWVRLSSGGLIDCCITNAN